MPERVLQYDAVIPAGTLKSAPITVDLDLDNWVVRQIDLDVPPGPNYLMSFAVWNNGKQWLPRTDGSYFTWDDQTQSFVVTDYPTGKGWQIVGYNTGDYDHTVTIAFHVDPPETPSPAAPTITFIQTDVQSPPPVIL